MVSNLIINGDLINPPTSISCFRELTTIAKRVNNLSVLIECIEKDFYWRYLKTFGAMDFVDDLVALGIEEGYRIDTELHFAPTVFVTDRIDHYNFKNVVSALGLNLTLV